MRPLLRRILRRYRNPPPPEVHYAEPGRWGRCPRCRRLTAYERCPQCHVEVDALRGMPAPGEREVWPRGVDFALALRLKRAAALG